MKKHKLPLYLLASLLVLNACKQNYTCTCTSDVDGKVINVSEYNLTRSDAESACDNADRLDGVTCVLELKN